jgi:hypothetical protein
MVYIGLVISLCINMFALLYIRWLLTSIKAMNEQVDSIWNSVGIYMSHLKSVYELETFYGDDTLKTLIQHGNRLMEEIDGFDKLLGTEEEEINEFETPTTQEEEEEQLFYEGS